jgi:cephalosporin-C deacetylase-like acetyl esterase
MINPYLYSPLTRGVKCYLKQKTPLWSHYTIDMPSAIDALHLGNNRITGEYFFPTGKAQAPLAILVHGMGNRSVIPCRMMAGTLAKQGIASFILYLVFHDKRIPAAIKGKYPRLSAEEWFESYQISVVDIHQVLDWAQNRPEIISAKISVAGISYGGFVSSIAMALDERIKAGIFIVCGGNSDKIAKSSLLLRWQYHVKEEEYRRNQAAYSQYLAEVKEKGFQNVIAGRNSYLTDPITFTYMMKYRPVMMVNALWDEMIPKKATVDLWEFLRKPPISWFPATHATIWVWYPWIGRRISAFLKTVFEK